MDIDPYNKLEEPIYHLSNIKVAHPQSRPRGVICLKRIVENPSGKEEFNFTAKVSSLAALKALKQKPAMAQEVTFKLREDVNNGTLLKLKDYLTLPDVQAAGITTQNCEDFIVPSPLHLVTNVNSMSSPVRLVVAPNRQNKITRQTINQCLHSGLHGLPSIQTVLLRYRFSLTSCLSDLSCYYKKNLLDPFGSLLSAIWLQGSPESAYPFLDPQRNDKLELWIMRSANLGFVDASSLAAMCKNSMGKFYNKHFPNGKHKLHSKDIQQAVDTLKISYSDDVLSTIFLPQVENEDIDQTFPHPPDWDKLTILDKAKILLKVNFMKLLAVADFNNFAFKEVQSLFLDVQNFLNQDCRLEINKVKETRPDITEVQAEIERDRTKINKHQNNKPDDFPPSTKDDFKFLGLLTKRSTGDFRLRGKPISFKCRTKGKVQITIRNTSEFQNFLAQGTFTRGHMASLMAHAFDPNGVYNCIYQNVARLLNRSILNSTGAMSMSTAVNKKWYPQLMKLVDLYFKIQCLESNRYLLIEDTKLQQMENLLIAFSDGSLHFSTSCVYIISINKITNECKTTLINTHCKISDQTKAGQLLSSIPRKESHGQLLACDAMLRIAKLMKELDIPLSKVFLGVDALSQLIALGSSPTRFHGVLRKYYVMINLHLFELAKMTGQQKQDCIFWFDQKDRINPADLLSKFNLNDDTADLWLHKTKTVLNTDWLKVNPHSYINDLLKYSQEAAIRHRQGGTAPHIDEYISQKSCECNFITIDWEEQFLPQVEKSHTNWSHLLNSYHRYGTYNTNVCLRIWGYALLAAHTWIDKVRIKKHKDCTHKITFCPCSKSIIASYKSFHPFSEAQIFPPFTINKKFNQASDRDQTILAKVGFLVGAVACANVNSKIHIPKNMDKYSIGVIRLNSKFCRILTGRTFRFQ